MAHLSLTSSRNRNGNKCIYCFEYAKWQLAHGSGTLGSCVASPLLVPSRASAATPGRSPSPPPRPQARPGRAPTILLTPELCAALRREYATKPDPDAPPAAHGQDETTTTPLTAEIWAALRRELEPSLDKSSSTASSPCCRWSRPCRPPGWPAGGATSGSACPCERATEPTAAPSLARTRPAAQILDGAGGRRASGCRCCGGSGNGYARRRGGTPVDAFRRQVDDLAFKTDLLEKRVNEVVRFYDVKKHGSGGRKASGSSRYAMNGARDSHYKGVPDLTRQLGGIIRQNDQLATT